MTAFVVAEQYSARVARPWQVVLEVPSDIFDWLDTRGIPYRCTWQCVDCAYDEELAISHHIRALVDIPDASDVVLFRLQFPHLTVHEDVNAAE